MKNRSILFSRRQIVLVAASAGVAILAACAPAAVPTATVAPAKPAAPTTAPSAPAPTAAAAASTTAPAAPTKPAVAATTAPAAAPTAVASPATAPSAKPATGVGRNANIKLSVWGDVQDKDVYDNIATDFNAAGKGATLTPEQWSGDYYQKLQTQLAGGVVPDLVYFQGGEMPPYAIRNVLVPLDDYIARDKYTKAWPKTSKAHVEQSGYKGKTYLSPSNSSYSLIFYNKEIFDKFGVPYPKEGWTLEQFKETAIKLTKTDPKERFYGYQSTMANYQRLVALIRIDGDQEWDTVVDPKKAQWGDGTIADQLDWHLNQAINVLKVSPTAAEMQGGTNQLQSTGNVAMVYSGAFLLPQLQGAKAARPGGIKFDVVGLPVGKRNPPSYRLAIEGQVMMAQSKERDAAWELQKWITDEPGQKRIAAGGRMPNIVEHIRKFWLEPTRENYKVTNVDAFLRGYDAPDVSMSHVVGAVTEREIMTKAGQLYMDKILAGQPARQVVPEMNTAIQKVLDDFWAKQKE